MATTIGPPPTAEYLAESTQPTLRAVMALAITIPTIVILLRCYVRIVIKRAFGLDDAVAVVAQILLLGYGAVCLAAADKGLGRHLIYIIEYEPPQNLIDVALLCQISQTLAIMACTLGKTSFAITLLRIFVQRWARAVLYFVIVTMNLVNVLCAIFVFAQCKDPRTLWNPAITSVCWPDYVFTNFSLFVGAYSGAQDFVLALLPWVIVWKLQMKKKEKLGVLLAMSLGIFAGATSIVKCTYLVTLSNQSDRFFALPPLLWWAAAEDGLAIVACSIPALRPLIRNGDRTTQNSKDSYPLKDSNGSNGSSQNTTNMFYPEAKRAELETTIEAQPGHYGVSGDERSDKSILNEHIASESGQPGLKEYPLKTGLNRIKAVTQVDMRYN